MKLKKLISGVLVAAVMVSHMGTITAFAEEIPVDETPVVIETTVTEDDDIGESKGTPEVIFEDNEFEEEEQSETPTAKTADDVIADFKAFEDLAAAEESEDSAKNTVQAAITAMEGFNALSDEDKALVKEAVAADVFNAAELMNAAIGTEAAAVEAVNTFNGAISTLNFTDVGETTYDYASLGGVTVNFIDSTEVKIILSVNNTTRVYGEAYIPAGITANVYGLDATQQAAFDFDTVFKDIPLGIIVSNNVAQNQTTAAGTYTSQVKCPVSAVTLDKETLTVFCDEVGIINVEKRPITVTTLDAYKTYGDSDPSFNYRVTSGTLVNQDTLYGQGIYREVAGMESEQVISQGYELKHDITNSNYSITVNNSGRLYINRASLVITGGFTDEHGAFHQRLEREYGNPNPQAGFSVSGLRWSDVVGDATNPNNLGEITVTFNGSSTSVPGDYHVVPSGLGQTLNNYDVSYSKGTLSITKRSLTITVDDLTKVYGDEDPEITYVITAPNAIDPTLPSTAWDGANLATIKGDVTRDAGENVGQYNYINGFTDVENPYYDITFVFNPFEITKKDMVVTVKDAEKFYGEANPNFEVTYSAFAFDEDETVFGGALVFDTDVDETTGVGSYEVKASGYTADNYRIVYVAGNLKVLARPITVVVHDKTSVYGEELVQLTFGLTCELGEPLVNGDVLDGTVAIDPADAKNVGEYEIVSTLSHPNYEITVTKGKYTITPAEVKVTIDPSEKYYGTETQIPKLNYNGFVEEDDATLFTQSVVITLQARTRSNTPSIVINVDAQVAGRKGDAPNTPNGTKLYEDAFTFDGMVHGNYTFTKAEGDLTVRRLEATNGMYKITGTKNGNGVYTGTVTITAEDGYKISTSDALEDNDWVQSITISGDGSHDVTFYIVREEDGAITNSVKETVKISNPPAVTVVTPSNPATGIGFLADNWFFVVCLAVVAICGIAAFVISKKKKN